METTADLLRAARAKIERPECWTRGEYARTANNNKAHPSSREARRWCAMGALMAVGYSHMDATRLLGPQCPAEWKAVSNYNDKGVSNYNDAVFISHADILALYDRAIAAAENPNA